MPRITGTIFRSTALNESVNVFVPFDLLQSDPSLDSMQFSHLVKQATTAIGRLNAVSGLAHSVDWLIYAALRKEALLTSQIEGTQATLDDLFDTEALITVDNPQDVKEVANYVKAFQFVRSHLRNKHGSASLPLCTRLLCEAHALFMDGARGTTKQPGLIRQSQNWIGGTHPGNAIFVPPPPHEAPHSLTALERFIPAPSDDIAPLLRVALVHAQFETILPF